jgi:hypothetical protein
LAEEHRHHLRLPGGERWLCDGEKNASRRADSVQSKLLMRFTMENNMHTCCFLEESKEYNDKRKFGKQNHHVMEKINMDVGCWMSYNNNALYFFI